MYLLALSSVARRRSDRHRWKLRRTLACAVFTRPWVTVLTVPHTTHTTHHTHTHHAHTPCTNHAPSTSTAHWRRSCRATCTSTARPCRRATRGLLVVDVCQRVPRVLFFSLPSWACNSRKTYSWCRSNGNENIGTKACIARPFSTYIIVSC